MAEKSTFVKIDRNIVSWRWFQNKNTLIVWLWLLMAANIEDHDFEHDTIRRGEVATSRKTISVATGLTEREVRTALNHLKETGEVSVRIRPKYQVISILNYALYQDNTSGKKSGSGPAGVRQKSGSGPQSKKVRNKEGKNEKNVCVTPTLADARTYFFEHGRSDADARKFYNYNQARGWMIGKSRITDWQSAADMWIAEQPDISPGSGEQEPTEREFE